MPKYDGDFGGRSVFSMLGALTVLQLVFWGTAMPLNVNDSDLTPDMTAPPLNHIGATEMIFVLQIYELGTFLRHSKSMAPFEGSWRKLTSHTVPLASKDKIIDELYDMLERKFFRYHDPVIPLHILARSIALLVTNRMRLNIFVTLANSLTEGLACRRKRRTNYLQYASK